LPRSTYGTLLSLWRQRADPSTARRFGSIERLAAEDIADAIAYIVSRPRHVAINEVLVRPTEQVD
jgi:NADP-dependent 3-hydroxy acid dehydrogenase YdfG